MKRLLLTEAVHSKAPPVLTSALLAEPGEDEANAGHPAIIRRGKGTGARKTSVLMRGQGVLFVFETKFLATNCSQVLLKFTWSF